MQLLLEEGGFTSDVPPETASPGQALTLRVAWAAFNRARVSVKLNDNE